MKKRIKNLNEFYLKTDYESLAKKHKLNYRYKFTNNGLGSNWTLVTHCLYNDNGCFVINCIPQREEISCYFTKEFKENIEEMRGKSLNIFAVQKDIWSKNEMKRGFRNPFYYSSARHVLKTLIEVIDTSIDKNKEFFGVKVE